MNDLFSKNFWKFFCAGPLFLASCSPLRTSPHDEKHQWELKLHEVQTNLDDLQHDFNCFQTELQILDGRIKYYENALANLKQQEIANQHSKIEQIAHELSLLSKKWTVLEKGREEDKASANKLASHANETTMALVQFKQRMQELEQGILAQNKRFEDLAKVKESIDAIAKSFKQTPSKIHKVLPGETLEKIASVHRTKVERIKKLNDLTTDLIVIDQELKIPID